MTDAPTPAPERHVVLVTGGRAYDDRGMVSDVLTHIHAKKPITALIEGGACTWNTRKFRFDGADYLARVWALENHVPCRTHNADWRGEGKAAGPRRNRRMFEQEKPDLVVAFPGGPGTADAKRQAKFNDVPVIDVVGTTTRGTHTNAGATGRVVALPTPPRVSARVDNPPQGLNDEDGAPPPCAA